MKGRYSLSLIVVLCFGIFLRSARAFDGFVGIPQAVNIRARTVVNVGLMEGDTLLPLSSGVIVDNQGYVLTVSGDLKKTGNIFVTLWDETILPARVIAIEPETGLAMLKIESEGPFPVATIKRGGELPLGSDIFVLSNPFGRGLMVARGIVSYRTSVPSKWDRIEVFISDAPYMAGFRGAPVFNEDVEIVGLVMDIFQDLSFDRVVFLSWQEIQKILVDLKEGRSPRRKWFGISARRLSAEEVTEMGLPFNHGIVVLKVKEGSPAFRAGLQKGDIILQVGDRLIRDIGDMREAISQVPVGVGIPVRFYRGGQVSVVEIVPEMVSSFIRPPEEMIEDAMGVDIMELTPELSGLLGLGPVEAVLVKKVRSDSLAERFHIKDGDIIIEVDHRPIKDLAGLSEALQGLRKGESVVLKVKRKNGYAYIDIGL